ncbi:phytanoyl-CoA dioxygenase family protein [Brevibacillus sp. AY1]|uniref:phytanoyl-CoA dioxygenase family protein n=1 Tax=Brevibacillus sp. AY1 TaxID=2807621 RepID=UPI0024584518|nr:phytanoyl-CoA dioxygenase family protein [Brevibacillus sp. AY1]
MMPSGSTVRDVYPSRVRAQAEIVPRVDPVVYRNESTSSGPLSAEQLSFYEKNGYLNLAGFFAPVEVQYFRDEMKRLWEENSRSDRKEVIQEPESKEVRSIFAVHRDNEVFRQLSRDPRLITMLEQILGSAVYLHQSRINYKKGFTGKEFYWHSDFETWHVEDGMPRMRALSCSISLEDNVHYNGPLLLLPGSHLPRSNVFMVYNSVENRLVAPFSGQQPRPDYIATRE